MLFQGVACLVGAIWSLCSLFNIGRHAFEWYALILMCVYTFVSLLPRTEVIKTIFGIILIVYSIVLINH